MRRVFGDAAIVGVTGGTSTPIEDLELVAARILEMAGTADARSRARELAFEALSAAATPAGRTSSLAAHARAPVAAAHVEDHRNGNGASSANAAPGQAMPPAPAAR